MIIPYSCFYKITRKRLSEIKPGYEKAGYALPKWIQFSERMLDMGFKVVLWNSKTTVSKYIHVKRDDKSFKVRFSNHKPNFRKEVGKDCDLFVGVTNLGCITTDQAIIKTLEYFNGIGEYASENTLR